MGQRAREEIGGLPQRRERQVASVFFALLTSFNKPTANAADSFRPEEPGQAAATLAQQAKDAYRTTVETAKQGLGKIFGGEIAPLKTGEMEGYVKDKASQAGEKMEEGARQMGWWVLWMHNPEENCLVLIAQCASENPQGPESNP